MSPYLPRQLLFASFQSYLNSSLPAYLNTQLLSLPEQRAASFSFPDRLAINFSLPEQQASEAYLNSSLPAYMNSEHPALKLT
jgi:hypothetical protein